MGRNNSREKPVKRVIKDTGKKIKKKPCSLCVDNISYISYKDLGLLRKYVSDRGKIRSRRVTGNCSQHQRDIASVVKTARELALLPYLQRTVSDKVSFRASDKDEQDSELGPTLESGDFRDFPTYDEDESPVLNASGVDESSALISNDNEAIQLASTESVLVADSVNPQGIDEEPLEVSLLSDAVISDEAELGNDASPSENVLIGTEE